MRIDISKFGTVLFSRLTGHEAFLSVRAYHVQKDSEAIIKLDFSQVPVLSPAWVDEFIRCLQKEFGASRIKITEGDNLSVKTTFETLRAAA